MADKKANISQIRKYLNGELNAQAMHKLEREALDDPFLQDALEGYAINNQDQQQNIDELTGRLNEHTEQRRRIIPWAVWPVAASLVMALAIGGLLLKKRTPSAEMKTADVVMPIVKNQPDDLKFKSAVPAAIDQVLPVAQKVAKTIVTKPADNNLYQQEISAQDTIAYVPTDVVIPEETAKPVNEPAPRMVQKNAVTDTLAAHDPVIVKNIAPLQSILQSSVEGVRSVSSSTEKVTVDPRVIAGTIISKEDGSPVIGAAIRVNGTNKSTVTDVNGKFSLSAPVDKATLDIVSLGYEPRQVTAAGGDSLKVELHGNDEILGKEPVVTHYGSNSIKGAHPQAGWDKFKDYLQSNAYLPDGTEGSVSLTFIVQPNGELTDFTIKKGLNDVANQKTIDLIKNGPAWVNGINTENGLVTIKVKFHKKK